MGGIVLFDTAAPMSRVQTYWDLQYVYTVERFFCSWWKSSLESLNSDQVGDFGCATFLLIRLVSLLYLPAERRTHRYHSPSSAGSALP